LFFSHSTKSDGEANRLESPNAFASDKPEAKRKWQRHLYGNPRQRQRHSEEWGLHL